MIDKQYNSEHIEKISIGLPVFNGAKFIERKIKNILEQTFTNFELIISDNASTDNTIEICKKFKDDRIKIFQQTENIGITPNYDFVLKKADGKYFAWTSVDDLMDKRFLEENLTILKKHDDVVCSSGQVESFGERDEYLKSNKKDNFFNRIKKSVIRKFSHLENVPANKTYEQNVRLYLKLRGHEQIFYGLFRTEQLKQIMVNELKHTFDWAVLINGLKLGNYNVVNNTTMFRYDGGITSKGIFNMKKKLELGFFDTVFMNGRFVLWCWKNLDRKLFLKNLDCFTRAIFDGFFFLSVDIVRTCFKKLRITF